MVKGEENRRTFIIDPNKFDEFLQERREEFNKAVARCPIAEYRQNLIDMGEGDLANRFDTKIKFVRGK